MNVIINTKILNFPPESPCIQNISLSEIHVFKFIIINLRKMYGQSK